jgi:hypothetical protein
VVPRECVFVHSKAGVIEAADGSKTCFLGSINETRRVFAWKVLGSERETGEDKRVTLRGT